MGKDRRKGQLVARWVYLITLVITASLGDLKGQVFLDHLGDGLAMWSLRVDSDLISHNQSMQKL